MGQDCRRSHAEPDSIALGVIGRRAGRLELAINNRLEGTGKPLPAQARRVMHPCQPGVEPGPQELEPVGCSGIVRGEELGDLGPQSGRVGRSFAFCQHNVPR